MLGYVYESTKLSDLSILLLIFNDKQIYYIFVEDFHVLVWSGEEGGGGYQLLQNVEYYTVWKTCSEHIDFFNRWIEKNILVVLLPLLKKALLIRSQKLHLD